MPHGKLTDAQRRVLETIKENSVGVDPTGTSTRDLGPAPWWPLRNLERWELIERREGDTWWITDAGIEVYDHQVRGQ